MSKPGSPGLVFDIGVSAWQHPDFRFWQLGQVIHRSPGAHIASLPAQIDPIWRFPAGFASI